MAEIFLSASIQVLMEKLLSPDLINFLRREGLHTVVKKWEKMLTTIREVLADAEEKQITKEGVKSWLKELRDLAYDVEDILDEFATEALRRKLMAEPQASASKVRRLIPTCCTSLKPSAIMFNFKMESKIKDITTRLQENVTLKRDLELREIAGGTSNRTRERQATPTSSVEESRIYGREEDKEAILELLLRGEASDGEVCVFPIIGMGGVGKTTLARLVYNDDRVKGFFDLKAWVCVSEEFDVIRVTRKILESFTSQTFDVNDLDRLQVSLKNELSKMKFLLVLDDVWLENYEDWTILRRPLEAGAPGSKIIVTTRNQGVAETMHTVTPYPLKELSNDDCLSIFTQHALGTRDFGSHPNLRQIGEEIVKRCKGLPLAAKTLGGLLRAKVNLDEWEDVLNSKIWDLPEKKCGIIPALRLSYYHLPPHLKQCFAYCSILPKDYEFEEKKLVLLWMAAGLVQQQDESKQMEDIGGRYFRDLLSRSFFQISSINESRFVMHDLINDLAQWVAGETCFRLEDTLEGKKQCKYSKKARHSSYVSSYYDGIKKFKAFDEVECLRTFLPLMLPADYRDRYLTNNVPFVLLPKLRCLRVLSLSGYHITELSNSIGDLKHLRYLDLSHTQIRSLPESISTLYNLQTLILTNCNYLKKLPEEMRNLFNLRHLDISGVHSVLKEMPLGIGMLTSLQTLSNFVVGEGSGSRIMELRNLLHLRGTLGISMLENVIDASEAREARLNNKQDLDVLVMEWSFQFDGSRKESVEEKVLDMLHPHKKLKELTIKCYGGKRLPTWIGDPSFSHMVLLRLENCVKCTSLPPLGQLPFLKDLYIERMNGVNIVGLEFNGKGCRKPFPSLENLSFVDMLEWKDWFPSGVDGRVEVFPHLGKLSINRCPKLSGKLPDHLPSLKKLIISECQQLVVSISSLAKLCELDIQGCQEVVHTSMDGLSSPKSMVLSHISKLTCLTKGFWQGLTKVEDLVIVGCTELTSYEAGLLQNLTFLRHLKIQGCPDFVFLGAEEVKQQQQQLRVPCRLESLGLYWCDNLEKLQGLHSLTSLRELTIQWCPRLVSFPETGFPSMLRELTIGGCDALKSLPQAMMHCSNYTSLEYLHIANCDSLTSIAIGQLPSTLKKLKIVSCKNLQSLVEEECSTSPSSAASSLTMHESNTNSSFLLEDLYIERCPSLTYLSSRGELPDTLKHLEICYCPKLESVAERLHNNTSLERIEIWNCESIKSLPEGLHNLTNLHAFVIQNCQSLVSFPDGGLPATNLREFWIQECEKLEALPDHIHNLTSLQKLRIYRCPGIVSFPEDGFPSNLTSLWIKDLKICKALFEWGLHRLTSLQRLNIRGGCPDLVSFPEEENGMILPTSMISQIWNTYLPRGFKTSPLLKSCVSIIALSSNPFQRRGCLPRFCNYVSGGVLYYNNGAKRIKDKIGPRLPTSLSSS